MRLIQLLEQTSRRPRPAREPGNAPSEKGYLYHATNLRHVSEIASSDYIDVFKPYFRDAYRDTWPDGSDEERAYFHANVNSVKRFMPKGQNRVIIRVPITAGNFQQEQETGYVYSNQPVDATRARILLNDGTWMFLRIFFKRWEKPRLAADYGGRPVGDPNAQQATDDLPEFMTIGGQEAYTGEKDVDYKPENIAAEDEASSQPIHKQTYDPEGRVYWDKYLESNKLRMHPGPGADAFLAWIIEAAGDIWREMTDSPYKHHGDPGYIIEKIRRIIRSARYRDWRDPLSDTAPAKVEAISKAINGLKPKSKPAEITKRMLQSIVTRDSMLVRAYAEQLYKALGIDEKHIREGPLAPEFDPTQARYDPELELGRTDQRQAGYNQGHPKP